MRRAPRRRPHRAVVMGRGCDARYGPDLNVTRASGPSEALVGGSRTRSVVAPYTHVRRGDPDGLRRDTAGKNPPHPLVRCGGDGVPVPRIDSNDSLHGAADARPAAPTFLRFAHAPTPATRCSVSVPTAPRVSWKVGADAAGYRQAAYELEVRRRVPRGGVRSSRRSRCWCPGRRAAGLARARRVRVRVRGAAAGGWSGWSEPATVEAGPARARRLDGAVHQPAPSIGGLDAPGARARAAALDLPGGVVAARLYATAHGVYERAQRPPRRRPRARARLDELRSTGCATRPTTSPTSSGAARNDARRAARQRLVPRPARLPTAGAPSTATGWRCSPSSR